MTIIATVKSAKPANRVRTYQFSSDKLKARRTFLGKTQQQIADAAGERLSAYARMEYGQYLIPSVDKAVRVAKALGCLVEDLLED